MKIIFEVSQFFKESSSEDDTVAKLKPDAPVKVEPGSPEKKPDLFQLLVPVESTEYEPLYPPSSQDAEVTDDKPYVVKSPGRKRTETSASSKSSTSSTKAKTEQQDSPDATEVFDGARIFAKELLKNRKMSVTEENIQNILADVPPKLEAGETSSSSSSPAKIKTEDAVSASNRYNWKSPKPPSDQRS